MLGSGRTWSQFPLAETFPLWVEHPSVSKSKPPSLRSRRTEITVTAPKAAGEQPRRVEGDASYFKAAQLDQVFEYVSLNREILIRHCATNDYSSEEPLAGLKPVEWCYARGFNGPSRLH